MIRPIDDKEEIPRPKDPRLVETRQLTPQEIERFVKPNYDRVGSQLPNPDVSSFIGTLRGDQVKAFLGLQVLLHAEPLWIEDGEANLLIPLVRYAERFILEKAGPQWVYLFAPPGKVARMAELLGMQLEPYCIYSKLVVPAAPPKPLATPADEEEPVEGIIQ